MCCQIPLIQTSKNGISRFYSSSMVNLMLGCPLLRKSRNLEAVSLLSNKEKLSSTYLNQMDGRDWLLVNQLTSKCHIQRLAKTGPNGDPIATPLIGHNIAHRIWIVFSSSRTQANLVSISFMVSSTSGLFFRTLAELSLSSTGRRNRRLSTKPVAGIVMLFTSAKLKQDYMIERLSTSKLSLKLVTPPLLLSIRFPSVTTSNGTVLRS